MRETVESKVVTSVGPNLKGNPAMKVQIEAEDRDTTERKVAITFEEIGARGWVRIEVDGRAFDVDFQEFSQASRSVCLDREE